MKILATSDLHGKFQNLENFISDDIRVICFAGDIAPLKNIGKWHAYEQKKWVQQKLCHLAEQYSSIEFVFTPGNHDFFPIGDQLYGHVDCTWGISWPKNMHMLINSGITIDGISFYGTPYVPIISHRWAFEAESDKLKDYFSKIPNNLDVLITHTPPHLTNETIDRSMQFGGDKAFGSHELANAIFEKQPRYAFSGHIHTGDHNCIVFNKTKCYNVSRLNEYYEIAYDPLILDIAEKSFLNEA